MSKAAKDLLKAVLKRGKREQSELVAKVQENLSEPGVKDIDDMTDIEFEAELNRRHEEAMRDPSVLIPWEQVKKNLGIR